MSSHDMFFVEKYEKYQNVLVGKMLVWSCVSVFPFVNFLGGLKFPHVNFLY